MFIKRTQQGSVLRLQTQSGNYIFTLLKRTVFLVSRTYVYHSSELVGRQFTRLFRFFLAGENQLVLEQEQMSLLSLSGRFAIPNDEVVLSTHQTQLRFKEVEFAT